jgi:5'(3')-deoxyribonucleotidase
MSVIYLDMDGVIADFFGGIEALYNVDHWKSIKDKEKIFVDLRDTDFFYTLETFENTTRLVDHIQNVAQQNKLRWGICSSPLRGDNYNSAYWKRRWLESNLLVPDDLGDMIFTQNKHKYTKDPVDRRPNILIDDKPENIERFNAAGGIGIRFQANQDDLEEYLYVQLEEAIARVLSIPKSSS